MGPLLILFFESRKKYSKIAAQDLLHAKEIEGQFVNRYKGLSYWPEKRKLVRKRDDPKLVDGRLYGVLRAKMISTNVFLLKLLELFDLDQVRRNEQQKKLKQQTICDFCGAFQAKLSVCSRCKSRRFCSTACQKKDWPKHKVCGIVFCFVYRVAIFLFSFFSERLVACLRIRIVSFGVRHDRRRIKREELFGRQRWSSGNFL